MTLEISDVLSLLAIIISISSFIVSIYFEYLKKPKLKLLFGDWIRLFYGPKGEIFILASLSFFNQGANYLGIRKVSGILCDKAGKRVVDFKWEGFFKAKNIAEGGKPYQKWYDYDGDAETIIVPGRQAVTKSISFLSSAPFEIKPGTYDLFISAYTSHKQGKDVGIIVTLKIGDKDSKHLRTRCKISSRKGIVEDMLVITLDSTATKKNFAEAIVERLRNAINYNRLSRMHASTTNSTPQGVSKGHTK